MYKVRRVLVVFGHICPLILSVQWGKKKITNVKTRLTQPNFEKYYFRRKISCLIFITLSITKHHLNAASVCVLFPETHFLKQHNLAI